MCKFCENVTNREKEIVWNVRSTYADDNICEFVNDKNCSSCDRCEMYFNLTGYEHNNNIYVGVGYNQKISSLQGEEVIIRPFSETIHFNYCPFCGNKISKDMIEFEKMYNCQIEVKDKED